MNYNDYYHSLYREIIIEFIEIIKFNEFLFKFNFKVFPFKGFFLFSSVVHLFTYKVNQNKRFDEKINYSFRRKLILV